MGPGRISSLNIFSLLLEELGAERGYVLAAVGPGRGAVVSVGGLGVKLLPPLCLGGSILLCPPRLLQPAEGTCGGSSWQPSAPNTSELPVVVVGLLLVSGESFLQPGSPKGSGCCEPQPVPHSPSFFLWLSFPLS